MTPESQRILDEAKQYVTSVYKNNINPFFVYHNLDHTRDVVRACELLANRYQLTEQDRLALLLAAWFHDTGYANNSSASHEESSQQIAADFLNQLNVNPAVTDAVKSCIMATKMPQSPSNLIEQIICDADLFHLGTDAFEENTKMLRQEINKLQSDEVGKKEWRQLNIDFLQRHRYFTDYGRDILEPVKQKHLAELISRQGKKEKKMADKKVMEYIPVVNPTEPIIENGNGASDREERQKIKKDKSRPERGIVAMFKIMSENHVNLSQMADSKANIMISVNTILISIMVSLLLGKLQFMPEFIIPTVIVVTVGLGAVVFAILATRPNISGGTFTKEDIANKKINLLFFGNFFRMDLADYQWAMDEMMKDKQYLYSSMVKDIYFLGVVLARKYKFLRISYNIFMFGLIIAIIAFGIAFASGKSF